MSPNINKNMEKIQLALLFNPCIQYVKTLAIRKFLLRGQKSICVGVQLLQVDLQLHLRLVCTTGGCVKLSWSFSEHNLIPRTSCFHVSGNGKDRWQLLLLFSIRKAKCPKITLFRTLMFYRISEVIFS